MGLLPRRLQPFFSRRYHCPHSLGLSSGDPILPTTHSARSEDTWHLDHLACDAAGNRAQFWLPWEGKIQLAQLRPGWHLSCIGSCRATCEDCPRYFILIKYQQYGHLNKIFTMTAPIDKLMLEGKKPQRSTPWIKNNNWLVDAEQGRTSFPQGGSPW